METRDQTHGAADNACSMEGMSKRRCFSHLTYRSSTKFHDCSPIPVFFFLYSKILPVTKMRLNVCFNEMALFGPLAALIAGRPGSSEVPRNPLTRWDVSSTPANGIFLTKKLKNKIKMPNGWRTIKSLVHKIPKFDLTVDEGKEWLNPSREKN